MSGDFGGWSLAAYQWEHENYRHFYEVKIDRHRAEVILRKLSRHFKTSCPTLSKKIKRDNGGHYTPISWLPSITLGANPSLGIVCHEYAHHLETVRHNSKRWHGKKFKRELKRVYTFAKRYLK